MVSPKIGDSLAFFKVFVPNNECRDPNLQSGPATYTLQFTNQAGVQTVAQATAPGC